MSREDDIRAYDASPAKPTRHHRPDGLAIWLAALEWERGRTPRPPRPGLPEEWDVTSKGVRVCVYCGMTDAEGHAPRCPTVPEAGG